MEPPLPDPKTWSTGRGFRKHASRVDFRKSCPNGSSLKRCERDIRRWGSGPLPEPGFEFNSNLPLSLSPLKQHLGRKKVNGANVAQALSSLVSETNVSQVLLYTKSHSHRSWTEPSYFRAETKLIYELNKNELEDQIFAYNRSLSNYVKSQQKLKPNYNEIYSKRVHSALKQKRRNGKKSSGHNKDYVPKALDEPCIKSVESFETFSASGGKRNVESILFDFGDNKYFTAFGTDWTWSQFRYWGMSGSMRVTIGKVDEYVVEFGFDREMFEMNVDKYHLLSKNIKNVNNASDASKTSKTSKISKSKSSKTSSNSDLQRLSTATDTSRKSGKKVKKLKKNNNKMKSKQKFAKDDMTVSGNKNGSSEIVFDRFGKFNGSLNVEKTIDEHNYEAIYTKYKRYDTSKSRGHAMTLPKIHCIDRNYQNNASRGGKNKLHAGVFARYVRVLLVDTHSRASGHQIKYLNSNSDANANSLHAHVKPKFRVTYRHEDDSHLPSKYWANMFHFYGHDLDLLGKPIVRKNDKYVSGNVGDGTAGDKRSPNAETNEVESTSARACARVQAAQQLQQQEASLVDKVVLSAESEILKNIEKKSKDEDDVGMKYCTVTITDRGRRLYHCHKRNGQQVVAPKNDYSPDWRRRDSKRLNYKEQVKQQMVEYNRLIKSGRTRNINSIGRDLLE